MKGDLLTILQGDALEKLRELPDESVQCCVTSPPYWGLRNYGVKGQLGMERTPDEYVASMVNVFAQVRRVLTFDGTLWLNLGDTYSIGGRETQIRDNLRDAASGLQEHLNGTAVRAATPANCKQKDLVGIPWMMAFALRSHELYLRSEITWCKKVPMPESVIDRPTSATEKIFLLSKSARYFYDADAVRNPPSESYVNDSRWRTGATDRNQKEGYEESGAQNPKRVHRVFDKQRGHSRRHAGFNDRWDQMEKSEQCANGSNMRNYWIIGPDPYPEAHFATFPEEIPKRCILAGCPIGGTVLDPFAGSGTTGMVALELGRKAILIDLNPDYVQLIKQRCNVTPGLALA